MASTNLTRRLRSSSRWSTRDISPGAGGGLGRGCRTRRSPAASGPCPRLPWVVDALDRRGDGRCAGRPAPWPRVGGGLGDGRLRHVCWGRSRGWRGPGRAGPAAGLRRRGGRGFGTSGLVAASTTVRGGLAELADALAERGADVRQLARADDDQRDDQDDDQLTGSDVERHGQSTSSLNRRLAASGGGQGSTASRAAHAAAAPRGARRDRRGPRRRSSNAARAMPRDTLTRRPATGKLPAVPAVAGPARTGPISPPWAPTPGTRIARPGAIARIAASSRGAVAPTDQATTVPPGTPGRRPARDPGPERLGGVPGGAVRAETRPWSSPRPGVGRPAQDVGEAVRALEERRDRLRAEVRADGDGVRAEGVEERDRLLRRRGPDVAALRVRDEQTSGGTRHGAAPGPPSRPTRTPRRTRGSA